VTSNVATVEVYCDEAGEFRWRAKAANGEVVASGAPPRFRGRVTVTAVDSDCWQFTGYIDRDGYGRYNDRRTGEQMAHRFAYRWFVGDIPAGLTLDHLCRNRSCVNPAHLEPVTTRENLRRGGIGTQTHCQRGHPFDEKNTAIVQGWRRCRACHAFRQRQYRQQKGSA
jgi:hypothetical protein